MILDPGRLSPSAMYHHMIAAIIPRPIAFVSTVNPEGRRNLAPFSYFCPISSAPPLVGLAIQRREADPKDTLRNIRDVGEFVVNIVSEPLLDAMVQTSGEWPAEVDEFALTGLDSTPSDLVRPPRVAAALIAIECRRYREIDLGSSAFTVGEILRMHVADEVVVEGRIDPARLLAVGRLGGDGYSIVRDVVRRPRPKASRAG